MKWREATLWDAVEFMVTRKPVHTVYHGNHGGNDYSATGIEFDDGSIVISESRWTGPYSHLTPDIKGDSPVFYIFDPSNQ